MTDAARGRAAALDPLLAAAERAGFSMDRGFAVVPFAALGATAIDPRFLLLVSGIDAPVEASGGVARAEASLPGRRGEGWALLVRLYGSKHQAILLPSGDPLPLSALREHGVPSRLGASDSVAAILVPPLAPLEALTSPWAMPWLSSRLRAADGCAWDREQTHGSLAKHLIEEAWELHDAIQALDVVSDAERPAALAALAGELGDVLLQVVLHAQLAEEVGAFDLTDVSQQLAQKIVRRHPHVFGDAVATTSRDVQRGWEAVKAEERAAAALTSAGLAAAADRGQRAAPTVKGALDGVSRSLPALSASRELQDRASAVGYDWPTLDGVREKLVEELAELDEALDNAGNPDVITGVRATSPRLLAEAQGELGDVLAVLVNLGRRSGIDAEAALRSSNDKFRRRFGDVEQRARARDINLKSADFATLDALWDEAKAAERAATREQQGEGGTR